MSESNHVEMPHCWKSHVAAHNRSISEILICEFSLVEQQMRLGSLAHEGMCSRYSLEVLCVGYPNECLQLMLR